MADDGIRSQSMLLTVTNLAVRTPSCPGVQLVAAIHSHSPAHHRSPTGSGPGLHRAAAGSPQPLSALPTHCAAAGRPRNYKYSTPTSLSFDYYPRLTCNIMHLNPHSVTVIAVGGVGTADGVKNTLGHNQVRRSPFGALRFRPRHSLSPIALLTHLTHDRICQLLALLPA